MEFAGVLGTALRRRRRRRRRRAVTRPTPINPLYSQNLHHQTYHPSTTPPPLLISPALPRFHGSLPDIHPHVRRRWTACHTAGYSRAPLSDRADPQPNANAAELFRFEADRAKWEAEKLLLEVTQPHFDSASLGRTHHSISLPIRYGFFVDS
jgi:hypothetical protein